jgi:DNA invertase Pin-like site-specific DNA recombinase
MEAQTMRKKRLKAANPSKAIGYIRVSTDKQARSGLGLAAQREQIEAYCTLKGLDLVDILVDEADSARKKPLDKRPEGSELLARVRAREVGAVVTAKLDRLFRRTVDALTVVERWDSLGTSLHVINFGGNTVDTSTAIGRMFLTFMSGIAQFEADLISERTSDAMQVMKSKGKRVSSNIPFGFKVDDDGKSLVEDDEEQGTLELIKELRYTEGLSVPKIRERLNSISVYNRGKPWHLTSLYRILSR